MKYFFYPKTIIRIILTTMTAVLFFASCQKTIDIIETPTAPAVTPTDLTTKVSSGVSGFVTDENNTAVQNALVRVGTSIVQTDQYGYFEVRNVLVVKTAALVTVEKNGYFNGLKTYAATENKKAFFRIKLIPKNMSGSFAATTGGTVTLPNGLAVSLPASAVVVASTGVAYNGTVSVLSYFINPLANDLTNIMPGDLRGLDDAGALKGLTTFGMAAVELRSASGEKLQIAPGKKATLTVPLTGAVLAAAPSVIPLWYFDETVGLWKQEGSATKTGTSYKGEVSHFSFWNCDLPNAIVPLTFTVVSSAGNPLSNIHVEIVPTTPGSWSHVGGYTDSTGYVSVFVTPNNSYLLTLQGYPCNAPLYTQNFSVTTLPVALGNIIMPSTLTPIISGTVVNCNNNPVTNGRIIILNGYETHVVNLSVSGSYSYSSLFCGSGLAVNIIGEDIAGVQQSLPYSITLLGGANNIPPLQACGTSTQQFLNFSINGTPHNYTAPVDTFFHSGGGTNTSAFFEAYNSTFTNYSNFRISNAGIAVNSSQLLQNINTSFVSDSLQVTTPINVAITEYGLVGQFISGNFAGAFTGNPPTNTIYNVVCNFRIRRRF